MESLPKRYDGITRQVLELLARLQVRGTFFVVGELARQDAKLVREIAEAGHEIGLHSLDHVPLPKLRSRDFKEDTATGKSLLEAASGQQIRGYRAPIFSLTKDSLWATDSLAELDFSYSSSVLPARHPFFSYPEAPQEPFVWPSGLIEIPAPVARLGPLVLPYLGGIYFRYLPAVFIRRRIRLAAKSELLWLYGHPHDFDAGEPFYRIKNTSWLTSALLWMNRGGSLTRVEKLLSDGADVLAAPPFCEQVLSGRFDGARRFQPTLTT